MSVRTLSGLARPVVYCASAIALAASNAVAAVAPYSDNFNGYTPGTVITPYTETLAGLAPAAGTSARDFEFVQVAPADVDLRGFATSTIPAGSSTTATNSGTAGIAVSGIAGNNFVVSSDVTLNSFSGSGTSTINFALGVLASNVNLGTGGYRITYAPFSNGAANSQKLVISELTGAAGTTSVASGSLVPVIGTTYTLTVTGDYTTTAGSLILNATLSDGVTSITTRLTDISPSGGDNFGYRVAAQAGRPGAATADPFTVGIDASFDNLNVALVPEPTTLAATIGGLALLGRRRRA